MSRLCDENGYGISCENYTESQQRVAELEQEFAIGVNVIRDMEAELDQCLTAHAAINDECERVKAELAEAKESLNKINNIRNSIVGLQTINWSEHIYPLVAALEEAGIEGMEYPEAKGLFGTMVERTLDAEAERDRLRAALQAVKKAGSKGEARRIAIQATGDQT